MEDKISKVSLAVLAVVWFVESGIMSQRSGFAEFAVCLAVGIVSLIASYKYDKFNN